MEYVQDKIFYHIQKIQPTKIPLQQGITYCAGKELNPFMRFFDNFYNEDPISCLTEYILYARETIFEEIRRKHFPSLPSRQTCIWVLPHSEEHLNYWINRLDCNSGEPYQILELKCTGKIFYGNENYVKTIKGGLNPLRELAMKYWSANDVDTNALNTEIIFHGLFSVQDMKLVVSDEINQQLVKND